VSALGREPKTPDEWIKRFLAAAGQRYTTCEFLGKRGMFIDQMYLTGYVVECALKALILHDTPESKRQSAFEELSHGASSHDFEYLRAIYQRSSGKRFPPDGVKILKGLVKYRWRTAWRYQVGKGNRQDAAAFLSEARCFLEWVKRRM
jgi:hypothetical protein